MRVDFWVIGGKGVDAAGKAFDVDTELRKQLVDESEDLYKNASDSMHDIKSKTTEAISTLQAKGEDLLKMASENIPGKKDSV